jgi:hypothetical protein
MKTHVKMEQVSLAGHSTVRRTDLFKAACDRWFMKNGLPKNEVFLKPFGKNAEKTETPKPPKPAKVKTPKPTLSLEEKRKRKAANHKRYVAEMKAKGRCLCCTGQAVPGKTECPSCAERRRVRCMGYRRMKKEAMK